MKTDRKTRSDSKLKNLPEASQAQIAEYTQSHTLAETVAWLAPSGIEVSTATLSVFLTWYRLRRRLAPSHPPAAAVPAAASGQHRLPLADRLYQYGHLLFTTQAIEKQNLSAWKALQQVAIRRAQLVLDWQQHTQTVAARKAVLQRQLDPAITVGAITPEIIARIEQELHLR